ncbi:MAG: APC family permease [Chloroflexota bacterium]
MTAKSKDGTLKRELGVFGATMMGLGSIVGTGVFVSIAIAAEVAGPSVIAAVALASLVAIANGINSAQLAANHPVSGGTYEYGYRYLNEWLGFIAGWMFLLAKSASAATAALGFAGYLLNALGVETATYVIPIGVAVVVFMTALTVGGIRRSNLVNVTIVSITIGTLVFFVLTGIPSATANLSENLTDFFGGGVTGFFNAVALMFVAYTGYGRIATLGEEVREPRRTIPRAVITTLLFTMVLYVSVAIISIASVGVAFFSGTVEGTAAPLELVAQTFAFPGAGTVMAFGAVTAMLGVLLNLILGLSRVLLAMGRRRDMPKVVARLNEAETTPYVAVIVMGVFVGSLVLLGDVRTTWSFSAVTVLLYYSLTNLSALQLTDEERLYPRWIAYAGLGACFFLTFWVSTRIYLIVAGLIVLGLVVKFAMNRAQAEDA